MIQLFDDGETLSRGAAERFAQLAGDAVRDHGRFSVALSGGSTPKRAYELLAQPPFRDSVPWAQVHLFWGDERCVPADDPRSNYRMTRLALLDHVPLPAANVHPVRGDMAPAQAAADYETQLRRFFGAGPPRFDLVLLGLGENGHTASLWPGSASLDEKQRWAAEVFVAEQGIWRVTLTAPCLNQGAVVIFLVAGGGKAAVLQEVLHGAFEPRRLPAQLIKPVNGQLVWFVDKVAAAKLQK